MKLWPCALTGLACLAAAGCRSDPNVALLERELRLQEDKMYELQERVEDYQAELHAARQENATLRQRSDTDRDRPDQAVDVRRQSGVGGAASTPLKPPVIDLPTESLPEGEIPEAFQVPERLQGPSQPIMPPSAPSGEEEPGAATDGDRAENPAASPNSRQVTGLALRTRLCGGYNSDGLPGDEGITVVFEPRDGRGRYVEAPAGVSVVVVDPALLGEAGRVARWDFTAAETARAFGNPGMARGVALEMVWPNDPPLHEELHLFVRYTTADGRKVQADGPIRVELEGGRTAGWVPTKPARPTLQASRPAELRRTGPSPRATAQPSPATLTPGIQRPVWSPDRL